jgi:hypothetical protein
MAQRDYQAEYARRIARGLAKRLSRSQARGHPRKGELPISPKFHTQAINPKLDAGLKALRQKKGLTAAAREAHVAPERLRRYVAMTGDAAPRAAVDFKLPAWSTAKFQDMQVAGGILRALICRLGAGKWH